MQLTELLCSFVRCREHYPNLSQSDVSEVLVSRAVEPETLPITLSACA